MDRNDGNQGLGSSELRELRDELRGLTEESRKQTAILQLLLAMAEAN
jgi:hypothetical protein